jgi:amidohydrolase
MLKRTTLLATALLCVEGPAAWGAGPSDAAIIAAVEAHAEASIEDRRWFHQHPELGNMELETGARVAATLEALGYEVEREVGVTGVLGLLDFGRPGPTVAIRADIDALPVVEALDTSNPVRSLNEGVMHACGHDIHMAVGLGAARVLAELAPQLSGRVLMVFQPAEEGISTAQEEALAAATGSDRVGAARLVHDERILERYGVDAIFGLHGFPSESAGALGVLPEYALASADSFELVIRGRSAHAGLAPWTGSDVLHIAAGLVLELHALPARRTDTRYPKVVSVSMLDCTDGRTNILCHTATLSGTVRTYRPEDKRDLRREIEAILDAAVKARDPLAGECGEAGEATDLCWEIATYDDYGPPVRQDPELRAWSAEILREALGAENAPDVPPSLGAEDFAYYCNEVPCAFFALGTAPPGGTGGLHTPHYAPSEDSIAVGMRGLATLAVRYLGASP